MKTYRKRVSAVVISENKILGFHAEDPFNKKKYFFLPGGECEESETIIQTAERETLEETGYRIKVRDLPPLVHRYDFEWNGRVYDSETWFVTATLISKNPKPVNDASYHRGVAWLPIDEIDTIFNYHPKILGAIRQLCYL